MAFCITIGTRWFYFRLRHYWKLFLSMTLATLIIKQLGSVNENNTEFRTLVPTSGFKQNFKTIFHEKYIRSKPKILLWTPFFGSMKWYDDGQRDFANVCKSACILTGDKREIETADAVVFHLSDITWAENMRSGFQFQFPRYRRKDQVWILYNLEPISMIFGNLGAWQRVFNWTWSFTKDSDVYAPYGQYRRLTEEESLSQQEITPESVDFFANKTRRGAVAVISNCIDDARRYKLIEYLRKFINVDVYGKCGKPLPDEADLKSSYQFYLAFENSDCREYVSEKYWSTLMRNQIPIVAWKLPMDDLVIPNSYINVRDFKDLHTAGEYIKRVSENRPLFNSYFEWKKKYKQIFEMGFCRLCENLKDTNQNAQVYHDMSGWLSNAVCKPVSVSIIII